MWVGGGGDDVWMDGAGGWAVVDGCVHVCVGGEGEGSSRME